MATTPESRSERVDLRMTPSAKQTLQHAAAVAQQEAARLFAAPAGASP
jgi:uncharacterized protein (DUF1778 family)